LVTSQRDFNHSFGSHLSAALPFHTVFSVTQPLLDQYPVQ
jgi:hypothetical protein